MKLSDFKSENAALWGKLVEFGVDVGVEFMMVKFAKLKCAEQRQICSEYADADFYVISPIDIPLTNDDIEVFVLNQSILQAPEPEM